MICPRVFMSLWRAGVRTAEQVQREEERLWHNAVRVPGGMGPGFKAEAIHSSAKISRRSGWSWGCDWS
jgi:hypothetical protein